MVSGVAGSEEELDGPVCYHDLKSRPRRCTDLPCLFVFLIFVIFLIVGGILAAVFGSPFRLLYGHDSFGNVCGIFNDRIDNRTLTGLDLRDKPYVFSFDINNPRDSLKICVSRCPDRPLSTLKDLENYGRREGVALCRYDISIAEYGKSDTVLLNSDECAALRRDATAVEILANYGVNGCLVKIAQWREGYGNCPRLPVQPSFPVLRRCVPDKASLSTSDVHVVYDFYAYLNSFDFFSQILADLYASYREVIGLSFAALVLSGVLLLVLYYWTAAIIYVILILVSLGSVVATALLWWAWSSLKQSLDSRLYFGQYDILEEESKNEIILLTFAILATALTVILFLMPICIRLKIDYVTRMYEEATVCIRGIPSLLLQPVWTFLILGSFLMLWCGVMLCLATSEIPRFVRKQITVDFLSAKVAIPDTSFTVIEYDQQTPMRFMWIFYVLALIWISEFILACQQLVVAGAISKWYFERDKKQCSSPVLSSISQLIWYHLGSVALGSFLITIFKVPRLIVQYCRRFLRRRHGSCSDATYRCCGGCWWIYDRFLGQLNHNAYAIIAVQGTVNFFPAGAEARSLLHDNALPMMGVNCVGDFVLFLGKCAITAILAILGIVCMKYDPQLHLYAIPLLLCCIFGYFIAHSVLSLYEMVIDTIFLCYCEDIRLQEECWSGATDVVDRSTGLFATPTLREFMASAPVKFRKPRIVTTAPSNE
ncbi:choline transporter-like 1 [Paramacrobiotus metropolitanus]|uniref:choline transporter-like 1 n=1 Tax=Paramacrobiotus metropolitanus TaxID=2943436 RepID=UPI0024460795|nr:choline transporter-like 1 [Paramacrobiotus metropolitanus]